MFDSTNFYGADGYYDTGVFYNPFQFSSFDRIRTGNNNWLTPRSVIYNIFGEPEKIFKSRKLNKSGNRYYMSERNSREVNIGELKIKDKLIINPNPDGTFDAFYCTAEFNGNKEEIQITIPYKNFVKRNILPYLSNFTRNPDCPDKYIILAFYQELLGGVDAKFLELPKRSGWQECGEKVTFAFAGLVIPKLKKYYTPDILERKLFLTTKKLAEAANELAKHLPEFWQYKLLLAIRITSLLLYFYAEAGLTPDQLFIIEPKSESNAKVIISILKNKNCNNTVVHSLTECRTSLEQELNLMNDGLAVFRDSSYIEDAKRRNAGLEVLLQDLNCRNGNENASRHLTAIVSDNPGNISSEIPAYFLTLNGCTDINDDPELQQAVGEFEFSLINLLANFKRDENLVTRTLGKTAGLNKAIRNSEYYMTERMLRTSIEILVEYQLISPDEKEQMIQYLRNAHHEGANSNQAVVNEFRKLLSKCIEEGMIGIANQIGPPYFDSTKPMVFLDDGHINIMASTLDDCILVSMKTTKKRNKLLQALKACDKLYANNNYKRNVDVEVEPGITETVSVYSFPKDILTQTCRAKVEALAHADYLFTKQDFPQNFIPIINLDTNKAAGRVIDDMTDEAESMYISGQTRSGKTHFLVQQAVIRAKSGNKVIIFDQTGAFTHEELKKHLPEEIISKYFTHWEISQAGLPVDLLSLENCASLPEKKNRLFSIFSVAAKITGEVQGKTLRKCLSDIVKAIDAGVIQDLPATLQFFDEAEIKERLEEVFDDLEGLETHRQNWGRFLDSQGKITVISTSADGIRKSSQLIDMLLANLYAYKQYNRNTRYMVILDEIEDLCLEKDDPINIILRKGSKHGLSMLLASQEFSADKDKLGKLIGNCGMHIFFHPKDADLNMIAKHIKYDKTALAKLEQGECVAVGGFYSHSHGRNCLTTIKGRTYLEYPLK